MGCDMFIDLWFLISHNQKVNKSDTIKTIKINRNLAPGHDQGGWTLSIIYRDQYRTT